MQEDDDRFDKMVDESIEALREQTALFVVLDPVLNDPQVSQTEINSLVDMPRYPLPMAAFPKEKRPYLLHLGRFEQAERQIGPLLRRALEEASGEHDRDGVGPRTVCAFIQAPGIEPADLAIALSRAAMVTGSSGTRVVFRYWDPRIASQLPRVLGDDLWRRQLQRLRIEAWWCYGSTGRRPQMIVQKASPADTPGRDLTDGYIRLTPAQIEKLEVLSWANRIVGLASGWDLDEMPTVLDAEKIVSRALQHGLTKETDILRFALAALSIHPDFDLHPQVAQSMADDQDFVQTMQGWSPGFIDELKLGAWRHADAD